MENKILKMCQSFRIFEFKKKINNQYTKSFLFHHSITISKSISLYSSHTLSHFLSYTLSLSQTFLCWR